MPLDDALIRSAGKQLVSAQRILLISHKRPDGDAIGSLLGLGLPLISAGKDLQMISKDGVPRQLRHIEGSEQILKRAEGEFDLVCVLDSSDMERIGDVLGERAQVDINIDHHPTNLNFARLNLVDPKAVSTTQIIAEILSRIDIPLTGPAKNAILTGLITDTLGFRTANTTPEALRLAADLMEAGSNLHDLYRRSLIMRSYESARLWGAGLSHIRRDGSLVWTAITLLDRQEACYSGWDDADLVNVLVAIDDAEIALIFMEQPGGKVKVSWRSRPGLDVSTVATHFGGGGHANAAGAEIPGVLDEVQDSVLEVTRPLLYV